MTSDDISIDEREHSATIRMERTEKLNALSTEFTRSLVEAIQEAESDETTRAIVITGSGNVFSAGADVDEFLERAEEGPFSLYDFQSEHERLYEQVTDCRVPVIAKVNGPAHGGAAELISRCDLAIASTNAEYVMSEIEMGLCGHFITQREQLPEKVVREMVYTGKAFSAEEGEGAFWNEVVPPEDLDDATDDLVRRVISKSPNAIQTQKRLLEAESIDLETFGSANLRNFNHPEFTESIRAFREDREPSYRP